MPKGSVLVKPGSLPLKTSRKSGVCSIKWTAPTAKSKKVYAANESCIVPLIKCIYAGEKPPPTSSADGVKMKCNNEACPFKANPYIHKKCFEQLEKDLADIMAKTGPGRDWPRKRCHAHLWTRALPYLQKFIRCRCENGQIVLDREAFEEAKENEKAEKRQRKMSEKEIVQPSLNESKPRPKCRNDSKGHAGIKVLPGWASREELEMRHWERKSLFDAQLTPSPRNYGGYSSSLKAYDTQRFREEKPALQNFGVDDADAYLKLLQSLHM